MKRTNYICDSCLKPISSIDHHTIEVSDFASLDLCFDCYSQILSSIRKEIDTIRNANRLTGIVIDPELASELLDLGEIDELNEYFKKGNNVL